MKKIKLFIEGALYALCLCLCFAFAGCSTGGTYIEGSFKVEEVTYWSFIPSILVIGSFEVCLQKAGDYTIEYELCQTDAVGNVIAKANQSKTVTKDSDADKEVYSVTVREEILTTSDRQTVKIQNVKVMLDDGKARHNGYAIGFGIVGTLLLGGLIAVFALDKLGKLTKLK